MLQNDIVWELQDMCNQLMVLPNAIALIALSGFVVRCSIARGSKTEELLERLRQAAAGGKLSDADALQDFFLCQVG